MREFAFTVVYDRGADHLMDVFIDHPGLYARTVSCQATTETMWRIDEVTGPRDALAAYDEAIDGIDHCSSLRGMGGCPIDWRYEVLASGPTSRRIYLRQSVGEGCRSVPYLAAKHLGDGVLCRAEQCGHEYRWRVLAEDDAAMSAIYDELEEGLREGLEASFERIGRSAEWEGPAESDSTLPYEQREALELATIEGTRALGLEDEIGSLTPSKRADLSLIRTDDINTYPVHDPVETVVFQSGVANVDTVLVDGQVVKRDGELYNDHARHQQDRLADSGRRILAESGLETY